MNNINTTEVKAAGFRFSSTNQAGEEVGRAYLYIMRNDLHEEPFGLMEDVFVDEAHRGQEVGTELVKMVVEKAKEVGCYKLIATSRNERPRVHELYKELGFVNHGFEFRIDFQTSD